MSYTALYRKFRPSTFEDVKGQDHIVTTLKNQMKNNRLSHAYLFCGTRGTGKTSVAKILAKAVNCETPVDGSPCGLCSMCVAIQNNTSFNVIEIDAASNNGVDNIRVIREEVNYRPTEGRYKVYIIDEVHMLSIGAFNALLKTLEEPPEYVIFILATTESHKIPITILSRCQQFDFRRISIDTIATLMQDLLIQEQVSAEEEAIHYIAKMADGSIRDGLSLLDQCIAFYMNQTLTYDHVLEVLGAVDIEMFSQIYLCIQQRNVSKMISLVEELIMDGREIGQAVIDFTWYIRNLLLLKSSGMNPAVIDASKEQLQIYQQDASLADEIYLLRYIRILSEASNRMRTATNKRILLETTMIKLCVPEMDVEVDALHERIRILEDKLAQGLLVSQEQLQGQQPVGSSTKASIHSGEISLSLEEKAKIVAALPEDMKELIRQYRTLIHELSGVNKSLLSKVRPSFGGENRLLLYADDEMIYDRLQSGNTIEVFIHLVQEKMQKDIKVEVRKQSQKSADEPAFDIEEYLKEHVKMPIIQE